MAGKGDHSLALLGRIMAALRDDLQVRSFVAQRIYDDVPARIAWPYLTVTAVSSVASPGSDYESDEHAIDVHVWSRHTNKTSSECRLICTAVQAALDEAELDLGADAVLADLNRRSSRVFRDPDNITWHGVVSFEAVVETED